MKCLVLSLVSQFRTNPPPSPPIFLNLKKFLFSRRVQLINTVVLVSGEQQNNSITHIYASTLFQILFSLSLLYNIEQSSLCYIWQVPVGYPLTVPVLFWVQIAINLLHLHKLKDIFASAYFLPPYQNKNLQLSGCSVLVIIYFLISHLLLEDKQKRRM